MHIVVIEPLGVEQSLIDELKQPLLDAGHTFVYHTTRVTDTPTLIERGKDADILVVANLPLPAEVIDGCPKLQMIAVAFTGVDHIALDACKARGIKVSNAAGYSTNAVAELAFGLMLSLYRYIPTCDERARTGGTKDGLVGPELQGKTLGIVGTGAIGSRVAEIAKVFGMHVLAYSRTVKPALEAQGVQYVPLDELLRESDIVSLHVPSNAETRGMIGKEQIALMKPTALLINTARGPVVDNAALAEALNDEKIAGAGLDVFDMEPPLPADYPILHAKHTVLTPHVAFATKEAMIKRAHITFENVTSYLDGHQINVIL